MAARLLACLLVPLSLASASLASANPTATDIVNQAVDGFVRPGYANFHRATAEMTAAQDALCKAPSRPSLESARQAFAATVDAWSSIELIRFGPVTEENRLERVLFWPDRKGTGLKQVQAALAAKDASATDASQLAGKSVAMQGLGALEFVLHGTGAEGLADASDPYRCAYGAAISVNLETIASDLETAWSRSDGFASVWANPGAANPLYRDGTESVTELMDVFVTGFELIRDVRLGGFLGADAKDDRPKQALFWRSGKTVDSLAANLASLEALFRASHLGDALSADERWIAQSAVAQFANAAKTMQAAGGPIAEVLADPEARDKLNSFALITTSLSALFGTRISGDLGLSAGFSSLDGD